MVEQQFIEHFNQCLEDTKYSENTKIGILFYVGFRTFWEANISFPNDGKKINDRIHLYAFSKYCPPIDYSTRDLFVKFALTHSWQSLDELKELLDNNPEIIEYDSIIEHNPFFELKNSLKNSMSDLHTYYKFGLEKFGSLINQPDLSYGDYYLQGSFLAANMGYMDSHSHTYISKLLSMTATPVFDSFVKMTISYPDYPNEVLSNHLFSNIFGAFAPYGDGFIWNYHRELFYEPMTPNLRGDWDFDNPLTKTVNDILSVVRFLAQQSYIKDHKKDFLKSDDYLLPDLKGKTLTFSEINELLHDKLMSHYGSRLWDLSITGADQMLTAVVYYYQYFRHFMIIDLVDDSNQ